MLYRRKLDILCCFSHTLIRLSVTPKEINTMRIAFLFVFILMVQVAVCASQPTNLLTDYLTNPLGTDTSNPGFSWRLTDNGRDITQFAYQIQVATSESGFAQSSVWDSGKVNSSSCVAVQYGGKPLKSSTRYYWRVRTWDKSGKAGAYSNAAWFETALLQNGDWKAKWVSTPSFGGNGYHSTFGESVDESKWVQIDLSKPAAISTIVLHPARPYNYSLDVPGFGFPVRYKIEVSDDPKFSSADLMVVIDRTDVDQPNPGADPARLPINPVTARYIRITATKLHHPHGTRPLLALSEMEVLDEKGVNLAWRTSVSAKDSIEAHEWSTKLLTDGDHVSHVPHQNSPIARKEFVVNKKIARARAYVTGLGYYEFHLNGAKIGDRVLDPARTEYSKRVIYSSYDVTSHISQGRNCAGIALGCGWWKEAPRFLVQIAVDFADGSKQTIISDSSWRWTAGPILENSLYNGETFDARLRMRGWDEPGYNDSAWEKIIDLGSPSVIMSAQMIQPIEVVDTIPVKSITSPSQGVYVVDFGQNFSGWCRINVAAPIGTCITLKHAELLHPDGTVNQENLRSARATDVYITAGVGRETYEPSFTYHGFRYVQVEGWPGKLTANDIQGRLVCTDLAPRGTFACSNDLINKIQECSWWGMRTNYHSIPTDCPQRDERQGWTGDAQMTASALYYNFDMSPACVKFLRDIVDAQGEDGSVPDTVPKVWGGQNGDPMWSAAYPVIVWQMYLHTGDKGILAQHYNGVKRFIDHLHRQTNDLVLAHNTYGDWVAVEGTPKDLISTGGFCWMAGMFADMSEALGKTDDATQYRQLQKSIGQAFHKAFYNSESRFYGNGSQFSNAMPLALGIVPADKRAEIKSSLIDAVEIKHKGHLSTGFIGTPFLLDALVGEGRADLAYKIVTQPDYPGWGYMIQNGATTVWELWQLATGGGMNSHNHPAFGFVSAWFYKTLAGLDPNTARPGWEIFTIKPYVLGDLTWAAGSIDTLRGKVSSQWRLIPNGIALTADVPPGSVAQVYLPKLGKQNCKVYDGSALLGKDRTRDAGDWVCLEVGSGRHALKLIGD